MNSTSNPNEDKNSKELFELKIRDNIYSKSKKPYAHNEYSDRIVITSPINLDTNKFSSQHIKKTDERKISFQDDQMFINSQLEYINLYNNCQNSINSRSCSGQRNHHTSLSGNKSSSIKWDLEDLKNRQNKSKSLYENRKNYRKGYTRKSVDIEDDSFIFEKKTCDDFVCNPDIDMVTNQKLITCNAPKNINDNNIYNNNNAGRSGRDIRGNSIFDDSFGDKKSLKGDEKVSTRSSVKRNRNPNNNGLQKYLDSQNDKKTHRTCNPKCVIQ